MQVRAATPGDALALATVHVASWRGAYAGLVPDDYLANLSVETRADAWRQAIETLGEGHGVLVLEERDTVIGLCSFGPTRDDDAEPDTGEVAAIYLDPSAWGRGGGTELLAAATHALAIAGHHRASLWVLDGNARARRFYESLGWVHDGSVKVDDSRSFPLRELRYVRLLDVTASRLDGRGGTT